LNSISLPSPASARTTKSRLVIKKYIPFRFEDVLLAAFKKKDVLLAPIEFQSRSNV
jgi:hypothetical protein